MALDKECILTLAKELYPRQVRWRRHFHEHPELSNREFETTRFIKAELARHKINTLPLKMKTGAVAIINRRKGPSVGVRTDIDALPITETAKVPYRSRVPGLMHACGHDVHMAVVLGTTVILERLKKEILGSVKILFQPAEEMPPGGASAMIKEGVLANPPLEMIFGLHTDPSVAVGKIGVRDGPIMASVTDFDITVLGRTGHGAKPHLAVDAIAVTAELVDSMQKIVSRETDPLEPIVITFGTVGGGTARNVIADKVLLRGTARTLSSRSLKRIAPLIKRTIDGICRARGAKYKLDFIAQYPVLSNDHTANGIVAESFEQLFGRNNVVPVPQSMGGEDFAYYLQKVPGTMFRLGIRNDRIGANRPWHTPDFKVDERAIMYGTALLCYAVLSFFERRPL